MEVTASQAHKALTKLSNSCHIMPYYGRVDVNSHLFRNLCRETRNLWLSNLKQLYQVILADPALWKEKCVTMQTIEVEQCLQYLDFKLELKVTPENKDSFMELLSKIPCFHPNMFSSVRINLKESDIDSSLRNAVKEIFLNKISMYF